MRKGLTIKQYQPRALFNNRPSNKFTSNCSLLKWLSQCVERGDLLLVWPCAWPAGDGVIVYENESNKVINSPCLLINVCHSDEVHSCRSSGQRHDWMMADSQQRLSMTVSFCRWKSTPRWTWQSPTLWTMSWDVGANTTATECTCMDVMQVRTEKPFTATSLYFPTSFITDCVYLNTNIDTIILIF